MPKEKSKIQLADFELKEDSQSLYKAVKDNPKDKIEVELGDSKDNKEFYPQAKIQRWDNEVNFSLRYKEDSSKEAKVVEVKKDVLVWSKGQKEVHIYEKPDIAEDGGLEIEVVLKEKPVSNVIEFSIETKGLDFFYQPELTAKEIKGGATRPENVVGSYAVYHKEKQGNFPNIEYKTGKFCHIYRPLIKDVNGSMVWGDLSIDEQNKLLTVTIDQGFLDEALYPVIVDPTFGYTSIGASYSALGGGLIYVETATLTEDGTTSSMSIYAKASVTSQLAIYDTASFESSCSLVGNTGNIVAGETGDWYSGSISEAISAGNYFLAMNSDAVAYPNTPEWVAYDEGDASPLGYDSNFSQAFGTWGATDTFDNYITNRLLSIYVTYTEGGGATEDSAERGLYLQGKVSTNAERGIYLQGKSTSSGERGLYLSGRILDSSERGLYLSGVSTSSSDVGLYLQGKKTDSGDIGIYLEGSVASIYTRESASDLETDDTNLTTSFTEQDYTDVATDDDSFLDLSGINVYFKYLFKVYNSNAVNTDPFVITWKGKSTKAPSEATVYLQVYNRTITEWETIDTDGASNENTEFTLTGGETLSLSDYYDGDYIISCRVYQEVT